MVGKSVLYVLSTYNSLYPAAMPDKDSKLTKVETAKDINQQDSERLCFSFNNKTWGNQNKPGFFKVKHSNPKKINFQHMSVI